MSAFWHKIGCCVVAKPPPNTTEDILKNVICEHLWPPFTSIVCGQKVNGGPVNDILQNILFCVLRKNVIQVYYDKMKKKRRRIDRSMIGEPTNFVHLTHIGSGEMADGMQPSGPMQEQMKSKVPHANGRNSLL